MRSLRTALIYGLLLLIPLKSWSQPNLGEPRLWSFGSSQCQTCPLQFEIIKHDIKTEKVQAFLQALESSQTEMIQLYRIDAQEYALLAHMAVGILGRESKFFTSWRYHVKEDMQWAVSLIKTVRTYLSDQKPSQNSRGPTQIKVIPQKVEDAFGFTEEDLDLPENAARATVGILIENLRELKQRAKNNQWSFVTPSTYVDYLPYIYFGAVSRLRKGTATPEKNIYVQDMKRYMTWVRVWELPPTTSNRMH
jgi:hypothetical protein